MASKHGHGHVREDAAQFAANDSSLLTRPTEFLDHIFHGDCVEGMQRLSTGSMNLVVTDPPFAIEFQPKRSNYNRTASRVLDGYAEIAKADYPLFTHRWMTEVFRLLKPSGSMFVFSGWNKAVSSF